MERTGSFALSSAPGGRRKRVVTPARREQNRAAQRAYRVRQRETRKSGHADVPGRLQPRPVLPRPKATSPAEGSSFSFTEEHHRASIPSDPSSRPQLNASLLPLTPYGVSSLADPLANTLQDPQVTTLLAFIRNGEALNFDMRALQSNKWLSPFFNPTLTPQDNPSDVLALAAPVSAPKDLRPTLPQLLLPHHAYLDLIPFPTLRAQAVMLATALPRVFDMLELKADVYLRGALVFRSYTDRGDGRQPWDARGWETRPWFRRKWALLLGGDGDGGAWSEDEFLRRIVAEMDVGDAEPALRPGEAATFDCPLVF